MPRSIRVLARCPTFLQRFPDSLEIISGSPGASRMLTARVPRADKPEPAREFGSSSAGRIRRFTTTDLQHRADYRGASFPDSSLRVSPRSPDQNSGDAPRNKSRLGLPIENYTDPLSLPPSPPAAHVATRVVYARLIYRARIAPANPPIAAMTTTRQPQPARTAHKF